MAKKVIKEYDLPKRSDFNSDKDFRKALLSKLRKIGEDQFNNLPQKTRETYVDRANEVNKRLIEAGGRPPQSSTQIAKELYANSFMVSAVHKYDVAGVLTAADVNKTVMHSREVLTLAQLHGYNMLTAFESEDKSLFKQMAKDTRMFSIRDKKTGQMRGRRTKEGIVTSGQLSFNKSLNLYEYTDERGIIWEISPPQYDKKRKVISGWRYRQKGQNDWIESLEKETPKTVRHYKTRTDFPSVEDWKNWKAKKRKKR